MRLYALLCLTVALVAVVAVRADIPANCHGDDVIGTWTFTMTPVLGNNTIQCPTTIPSGSSYLVTLSAPNTATDVQGHQGTWTMIYNQGFEVRIGGRRFFAFSSYAMNGSQVISYCSKTSVGFYHDDVSVIGLPPFNWGCYSGAKNSEVAPRVGSVVAEDLTRWSHPADFHAKLNSAQKTWKARPRSDLEGVRLAALAKHLGIVRPKARYSRPLRSASAVKQPIQVDAAKLASLPDQWDWTNASGVNFDSPMRDQLSCGSCYSFSTTSMLESRIRIMTNNTVPGMMSPQDVVSCSPYSQGCDGGFPYLVSKYAQDFGLMNELDFGYQSGIINSDQGTGSVPCQRKVTDQRKLWHTSDYHYVGGFYGACSEEAMKWELYSYGPLAVGFEVYPDFFHYESGVYHHVSSVESPLKSFFEETSHAVLVVGWGVDENGTKYWKVKNSWGRHFGLTGYFLIERGNDECAIESMAVGSIPVAPLDG